MTCSELIWTLYVDPNILVQPKAKETSAPMVTKFYMQHDQTAGFQNTKIQLGRYKKIGYNIYVLWQTACLVVNPIKVNNFAYLSDCTTVVRPSDRMMVPS